MCVHTAIDCNDSMTARYCASSSLYVAAPTRIVAAVTRYSADNGASRLGQRCAIGHHHAVITFYVCTQSRMVAAVTQAVTAVCSDGL
jgi:hypothetical protein